MSQPWQTEGSMSQSDHEDLRDRLKRLRDAQLLTQAELATKSGVPLPTIKDIERGATIRPRNQTLRALSHSLDVDPIYLLHGYLDYAGSPRKSV